MHDADDINVYLTTEELALRYGLTSHTIRRWRSKKQGPQFYNCGRIARNPRSPRIRYSLQDVLAWEQSNNIYPIN